MVEFALILPVLVMLLMGIVEFGRAYNIQLSIQAAAREGARDAALGESFSVVEATVFNAASPQVPDDVDMPADCDDPGDDEAVVEVTKSVTFGIPFVPVITKTLSARGVMRCGV
jgi:Flp pilus assembly protein TadG